MSKNYNNKQSSRISRGGEKYSTSFDVNTEPILYKPLEVVVHDNFDIALKRFRAMVQKERILSIFKDRQRYEKPSDRRRRLINESQRKQFELQLQDKKIKNVNSKEPKSE